MSDDAGKSDLQPVAEQSLPVMEEPLDPANQALADALRLSFRILKAVMIVLVVLFLFSGFFKVGPDQEGVVLRLGQIVGDRSSQVKHPGWHFALPAPIDEKVVISTKFKELETENFYFRVEDANKDKDLDDLGGRALEPGVDGAMLTGDRNIVHARWVAQYRISDPVSFVTNVYDEDGSGKRERAMVKATLENAVLAAVGRHSVDDVIRGPRLDEILDAARTDMDGQLKRMNAGLEVNWVKFKKHPPTPPLLVRPAFKKVLEAESARLKEIETARKKANELLIGAAGENYTVLIEKLDALERTGEGVSPAVRQTLEEEAGVLFETLAGGWAINRINQAKAVSTQVEQEIKADWEQFSRLLPEYRTNPVVVMRQLYWNVIPDVLSKAKKWYVTKDSHLVIDMTPPAEWSREEARKKYGVKK